MVINLEPPKDNDQYVHRSGRTGRAGKAGVCITLVSSDAEEFRIKDIERFIGAFCFHRR